MVQTGDSASQSGDSPIHGVVTSLCEKKKKRHYVGLEKL